MEFYEYFGTSGWKIAIYSRDNRRQSPSEKISIPENGNSRFEVWCGVQRLWRKFQETSTGRNYPETVRLFAVNDKNWRREVLLHGPRFRNIKSQFHAVPLRSSIVTKVRSMAEKNSWNTGERSAGWKYFIPWLYVFEIRGKSIRNKYIYIYIHR